MLILFSKDKRFNFRFFPALLLFFFFLSFATIADYVLCKDILPDDLPDICISDNESPDISKILDNSKTCVFPPFPWDVPLLADVLPQQHFVNLLSSQSPPSAEVFLLRVLLC